MSFDPLAKTRLYCRPTICSEATIHTRVSSTVCNRLFMRGLHRNRSWATPCLRDWPAWYTLRYKWWYTARYTHCDHFAHAMFLVGQFWSHSNKFVPQVKAGFLTRSRHCQNWFEAERKTIVLGAQGAEGTLLFFFQRIWEKKLYNLLHFRIEIQFIGKSEHILKSFPLDVG